MFNIIFVALLTLSGANTGSSLEMRDHVAHTPTFPDDLTDCWTEDNGKTEVCNVRGVRVTLLPTVIVETSRPKRKRSHKTDVRVMVDCAGTTDPLCGMP